MSERLPPENEYWSASSMLVENTPRNRKIFLATCLLIAAPYIGLLIKDTIEDTDWIQAIVKGTEYDEEKKEFCITQPIPINTPVGKIQIGDEGNQDMSDPIKRKIVDVLKRIPKLVKVECQKEN